MNFQKLLKQRGINVLSNQIEHTEQKNYIPLSSAQKRIWFQQQIEPKSIAYNNPSVIKLTGSLNYSLFEEAIKMIHLRHKIINSVFFEESGIPFQKIIDPPKTVVKYIDMHGQNNDAVFQKIKTIIKQIFDLEKGPLMETVILQTSKTENIIIFNLHHIIFDGWSKNILLKDIISNYRSLIQGKESRVNHLKIQYYDYVRWENNWVQTDEYNKQLAFWTDKLNNLPSPLSLPIDYQRPKERTGNGMFIQFELSEYLSSKIIDYCKTNKITLFLFLLAAYKILLYRYTYQSDILVGIPVAKRNKVEIENLIGMFVNTVVIRSILSDEVFFADYIKSLKLEVSKAYTNQDLPFDKIVEKINPVRDLDLSPFFQVMFQFDTDVITEVEFEEFKIKPLQIDMGISQLDLSVSTWLANDKIQGTFEFCTDLFKIETIEKLIEHYKNIISSILSKPEAKIHELDVLSAEEKETILYKWNNNKMTIDVNFDIIRTIESFAISTPNKPAICYKDLKISYKQLQQKVKKWATIYIKNGVKPNDSVAIFSSVLPDVVIQVLASLKVGAVFTIIDTECPIERVKYIADNLTDPFFIIEKKYESIIKKITPKLIPINGNSNTQNEMDQDINLEIPIMPHQSDMCIIYTSGSRGNPKGIVLSYQSIINLIFSFKQSYSACSEDCLLPITSVGSASFVGEVFPILVCGGTLILVDNAKILDMDNLVNTIIQDKVTILSTIPSMINRLNSIDSNFGQLRLLLSGSENLHASYIDKLPLKVKIANGYGLTETGICNTFDILDRNYNGNDLISLGKPIINNQVYILDKNHNCVPVGVKAEIFVSGDSLGSRYYKDTEQTQKNFLSNPFEPNKRMFKTGDIGFWSPEGKIFFCGRNDRQIQIRGYRVELQEIEEKIISYPSIFDVAVILTPHNKLAAYLSTINRQILNINILKQWLRDQLPSYMLPDHYFFIDTIPRNLNGKVDLKKLFEINIDNIFSTKHYEPPQTETERIIADIWKETLSVKEIDIHDNFFDIGGHSLLLSQVYSILKKQISVTINIVDLLKYPTVYTLAQYIDNNSSNKNEKNMLEFLIVKDAKRSKAFTNFAKNNTPLKRHNNDR